MRTTIGLITLGAGVVLLFAARRERAVVPPWMPRVAWAVTMLGASTLAGARAEIGWSIASMLCSVAAIVLLVSAIRQILRR